MRNLIAILLLGSVLLVDRSRSILTQIQLDAIVKVFKVVEPLDKIAKLSTQIIETHAKGNADAFGELVSQLMAHKKSACDTKCECQTACDIQKAICQTVDKYAGYLTADQKAEVLKKVLGIFEDLISFYFHALSIKKGKNTCNEYKPLADTEAQELSAKYSDVVTAALTLQVTAMVAIPINYKVKTERDKSLIAIAGYFNTMCTKEGVSECKGVATVKGQFCVDLAEDIKTIAKVTDETTVFASVEGVLQKIGQYLAKFYKAFKANTCDPIKTGEVEPEVKVPEVKVPEVKVPEVKVPEVKVPPVKAPERTPTITKPKPDTGKGKEKENGGGGLLGGLLSTLTSLVKSILSTVVGLLGGLTGGK